MTVRFIEISRLTILRAKWFVAGASVALAGSVLLDEVLMRVLR